ncbi:MAG TPA: ELWxxDGT repeat protein, partial [Flavobacteriales bacterium]
MLRSSLCLVVTLCCGAVQAQAELVADFGGSTLDAFPRNLTPCGDRLFFTAYTPDEGWELWVTDGTLAGSHLVKDINPGAAHGTDFGNHLTAVGGTLFFMARDAEHGRELWRSDGTEAGTVMVADIWSGPNESIPTKLFALGDVVVFTAEDAGGRKLHASDGNTVVAITEHPLDIAASVAPLVIGDVAYFSAWTPMTDNYSLWSTTASSATLVKNIFAGFGQSAGISELTLATGGFYFRANTPDVGAELWRSNGTEGGTALVGDMLPGEYGLEPRYLTVMGGDLYFVG